MNDDWAKAMQARLRAAAHSPPTGETLRPAVEAATRRTAAVVAARGASARVRVDARASGVMVSASGPGARQVLRAVRGELRRVRPQLHDAVRAEARAKIGGTR